MVIAKVFCSMFQYLAQLQARQGYVNLKKSLPCWVQQNIAIFFKTCYLTVEGKSHWSTPLKFIICVREITDLPLALMQHLMPCVLLLYSTTTPLTKCLLMVYCGWTFFFEDREHLF